MTRAVALAKTAASPRRGLSRIEAAVYIGIGITTFDKMVESGEMPRPRLIGGRKVWDVRAIDSAFDNLPGEGAESSWDDR